MINKKGVWDTTKTMIVIVIVFGVLLIFTAGFKPFEQSKEQKCHQSVIYKATVPEIEGIKVTDIPLQCETKKICIVTSGLFSSDNCDQDYLGEKYDKIKISSNKLTWDDEINKIISEHMQECWWMMGEGRLTVYSREADLGNDIYCNICARIAFGEKLQEELKTVKGTQKYQATHTMENSDVTYWQYFSQSNSNYIYNYKEENDKITTTQKAIIFLELEKSSFAKIAPQAGGVVTGVIFGFFVPPLATVGIGLGGYIGHSLSDEFDKFFTGKDTRLSSLTIANYDLEGLKEIKCKSFEVS